MALGEINSGVDLMLRIGLVVKQPRKYKELKKGITEKNKTLEMRLNEEERTRIKLRGIDGISLESAVRQYDSPRIGSENDFYAQNEASVDLYSDKYDLHMRQLQIDDNVSLEISGAPWEIESRKMGVEPTISTYSKNPQYGKESNLNTLLRIANRSAESRGRVYPDVGDMVYAHYHYQDLAHNQGLDPVLEYFDPGIAEMNNEMHSFRPRSYYDDYFGDDFAKHIQTKEYQKQFGRGAQRIAKGIISAHKEEAYLKREELNHSFRLRDQERFMANMSPVPEREVYTTVEIPKEEKCCADGTCNLCIVANVSDKERQLLKQVLRSHRKDQHDAIEKSREMECNVDTDLEME